MSGKGGLPGVSEWFVAIIFVCFATGVYLISEAKLRPFLSSSCLIVAAAVVACMCHETLVYSCTCDDMGEYETLP